MVVGLVWSAYFGFAGLPFLSFFVLVFLHYYWIRYPVLVKMALSFGHRSCWVLSRGTGLVFAGNCGGSSIACLERPRKCRWAIIATAQ